MKANILEVFQSVQGEGQYAGAHQVFVRFFECNMHCVWCDTPNSIGDTTRRYDQYTLDELWSKIMDLWEYCHSVSLTGGEPLIQKDFIKKLLLKMNKEGIRSYLETNGIYYEALADIIGDTDIIAMDIKLPSSTKCQPYWSEHEKFLKISREKEVFVKTVISSETTEEDVARSIDLVQKIDPNIVFFLQPNYFDRQNGVLNQCIHYQKKYAVHLKNIRILPQVHKYMKLP